MNASIVLGALIGIFLTGILLKSSWEYFWKDVIIVLILLFVIKACSDQIPEGKYLTRCVCQKENK